jgi:hypothetical protein
MDSFEIDDAGGCDFQVIPDGGGDPVGVSLAHAVIVIAVDEPRSFIVPSAELIDFLAGRGLEPTRGQFSLGEGILCEGERVTVHGFVEEIPSSDGYREMTVREELRGRHDAPVVIRRAG